MCGAVSEGKTDIFAARAGPSAPARYVCAKQKPTDQRGHISVSIVRREKTVLECFLHSEERG